MRVAIMAVLGTTVLFASVRPTNGTAWNPFDQTNAQGNFLTTVQDTLFSLFVNVRQVAGRAVSRFLLPNPLQIGIRNTSAYRPPVLSPAPSYQPARGARGFVPAPSPTAIDVPGFGTPGGGDDSDPFWADDCSCVSSIGAKPGVTYEVGNRCPEDPDQLCEACRRITRHDRLVTSRQECLSQDFGDPSGGSPSGNFHGL